MISQETGKKRATPNEGKPAVKERTAAAGEGTPGTGHT